MQLPVLVAGPLARYHDFSAQLSRSAMTLGAFAYGMRRIVTGLIKALLVGGVLAETADTIYATPITRLTAAAAWLGAACVSLQIYLQFSGYCDVGIGVGRMIGLRYSENFRRPYTADSIREFWRRWNITLMTWLRDYLFLPIVGQDDPTPRLYLNIVAGFCLVALWHRGGSTFLVWGVYCGSWLALEAIGFHARVERLPRSVRHLYVLMVVVVGWVILRSPDLATARQFLAAMAGLNHAPAMTAARFGSIALWCALAVGLFAAGPLVPSISRWRVSVDAATTSLLMMIAATGVFLWRGPSMALRSIWPKSLNP
jgi:alginate O-acetyltransferase complex protein AlgI